MKMQKLQPSADNLRIALFGMHADFKSYICGTMMYGHRAPITVSKKQELNMRSSRESKLVGADDMAIMIIWTKLFLEEREEEEHNTGASLLLLLGVVNGVPVQLYRYRYLYQYST